MFVDTDTILSVLNIYHVMLWVGKHAISIYSQFLRGVFTTRSAAGICMNMPRVLACEVWVLSGLQPQEMLFTMQS